MSAPVILVRTDASVAIGLGHAMRCLALTQALADERGGRTVFLMPAAPDAFAARARREGATLRALRAPPGTAADARETAALAGHEGAAWVVVDGYDLDGGYQLALVDGGASVLALDDHVHADRYHAHLVLNQNPGADEGLYADRAPHTRLLLGPRYALLRREFRTWDAPPRAVPVAARRVLVALGGSDPDNVSARVLAGLAGVRGPLEVQVLVGGANPHRHALERVAAGSPHAVELAVDAFDVPRRMAWADLAVAAAGGGARELARVGTPQALIVLADNQRPAGEALVRAGVAVSLGWHADVTEDVVAAAVAALAGDAARRARLAQRGRELVDGRGALRVLAAMGLAAIPSAA